ncbi:MAG: hypothetical protein R3C45_14180 [Phycisphaerales bacterium]
MSVVFKVIDHFKQLVENNGLNEVIYPCKEKASQLLFFAIADAYCRANNLDLSPEVDSGRGPVDFKVSSGSDIRVLVYSSLYKIFSGKAWV